MREIVLDTETTGLEPGEGHRVVEIGALELVNHLPSGRSFHSYLNPERDMPSACAAPLTFGKCTRQTCSVSSFSSSVILFLPPP